MFHVSSVFTVKIENNQTHYFVETFRDKELVLMLSIIYVWTGGQTILKKSVLATHI